MRPVPHGTLTLLGRIGKPASPVTPQPPREAWGRYRGWLNAYQLFGNYFGAFIVHLLTSYTFRAKNRKLDCWCCVFLDFALKTPYSFNELPNLVYQHKIWFLPCTVHNCHFLSNSNFCIIQTRHCILTVILIPNLIHILVSFEYGFV